MTEHQSPSIPRFLAWVALAVCATGNAAVSIRGAALGVHIALGVATILCIAVLVAPYLRRNR